MPRFIDTRPSDPFEDFDFRIKLGGEADAADRKVIGPDFSSDPNARTGEDGAGLDLQKDSASPGSTLLPDSPVNEGGETTANFVYNAANMPPLTEDSAPDEAGEADVPL